MSAFRGNKILVKSYSKWSYAFLELRSSECTCARKSACFVSRIIKCDYNSPAIRLRSNWRTLLVQQCRLTKVEPFDIPSQQCGNVCDQHDHAKSVFSLLSNISAQHMCTFTETDLSQTSKSSRSWTQEAVNMAALCCKLLWGWYISEFKLMEDQEWTKINVKSTSDV